MSANALVGATVRNESGETLGKVEDLYAGLQVRTAPAGRDACSSASIRRLKPEGCNPMERAPDGCPFAVQPLSSR